MPAPRLLAAALAYALAVPAAATIDDLTTWDFYRDPSDPNVNASMTGSVAPNLAELNFINDLDIPAGYDIGFSSVNANSVVEATSGYYFDSSQDFTIRAHFSLQVTDPAGFVGIGMGIGEDRAGFNSAGIGFGVGTGAINLATYGGAATNNDAPVTQALNLFEVADNNYSGSLTVSYDASSGDVTVGAAPLLGIPDPLAPTQSVTFSGASDLVAWNGDDLVVSFFLRSDDPSIYSNWSGETANADFFDFTVVEGAAIQVPEPTSLALIALGGLAMMRRRS
ncbi:MAG: PEP-CTERM sorting domain-containing protein [Phycisphaeraceae bacterium]|nr:PEP-CTERM sorting domain-containing protein [Phycisphaeraceae bacterium]